MKISWKAFSIKFKKPFVIPYGTRTHQDLLIVKIEENGYVGYGEVPAISYYDISVDSVAKRLYDLRETIESRSVINSSPNVFFEEIAPILTEDAFLLNALDCAAHDLFCKSKIMSLSKYWGIRNPKDLLTNYTISIGSKEDVISDILTTPWPSYKLKMSPEDCINLPAVRKSTNALLRIDGNCSWTSEKLTFFEDDLIQNDIEFIEQPLPVSNWEEMRAIKRKSRLKFIADESCQNIQDVIKCTECFHGVNIKTTKSGGLIKARAMIMSAKEQGLEIMIGCMSGSSIGITPLYHLGQFSGYNDLDGAILLEDDIAVGLKIINGKVSLRNQPGIGFEIKAKYSF